MSFVFNPFSSASADEISQVCLTMAGAGLSAAELAELEDQIEATVPALVELRDAGHIELNTREIAVAATVEGMMRLAEDSRLTELSRNRCRAMRDRMVVQGVKQLLGHL